MEGSGGSSVVVKGVGLEWEKESSKKVLVMGCWVEKKVEEKDLKGYIGEKVRGEMK